jgi:chorismate-pyruvate lyase
MSQISVVIERRTILDGIYELQKKMKTKIPIPQKVLFAATGTLEKTLSLFTGSETEVRILEQRDLVNVIFRSANIVLKKNSEVLVNARSKIYPPFLPYHIVRRIRKKQESIGDILDSERLETFKSIRTLGYDPHNRSFYKIYHIIFKKNIAFNIKEIFLASLKEQVNFDPLV